MRAKSKKTKGKPTTLKVRKLKKPECCQKFQEIEKVDHETDKMSVEGETG